MSGTLAFLTIFAHFVHVLHVGQGAVFVMITQGRVIPQQSPSDRSPFLVAEGKVLSSDETSHAGGDAAQPLGQGCLYGSATQWGSVAVTPPCAEKAESCRHLASHANINKAESPSSSCHGTQRAEMALPALIRQPRGQVSLPVLGPPLVAIVYSHSSEHHVLP